MKSNKGNYGETSERERERERGGGGGQSAYGFFPGA